MQEFTHQKIRDLGDIITDSFQYIRIHFKSLGKALLFFVLPLYIIQFFMMKGYTDQLFTAFTAGNFADFNTVFGPRYFLGIALSIIASATLTVVTLKHLKLTEGEFDPTPEAILEDIVPNVLKYIGLYIVYFFVLIFSAFLFFFPMIFFGIKFCLSTSALILEEETVFGSMSRSWELTKDNWWATFAIVFVMYILMIMVTYAILIPITILSIITVETGTGEVGEPSFWVNFFYVLTGIMTAISSLISTVIFIAISLQYYNLVERKEGGSLRSQIEGLLD
jgi:hypothetical protein